MVDKASLQIEIKSTGAKEAKKELDNLTASAEDTTREYIKLKNEQKAFIDESGKWRYATGRLVSETDRYNNNLKNVTKSTEDLSKSTEKSGKTAETTSISFKKIGAVLAGLGLAAAAKGFIEIADSMNLLEARIKLAERGLNTYKQTQEKLLQIANENRSSIKATTELYVKLVDPIRQLGGTTQTAMNVTSAFSKALMLGGASTAEAASATLQFAQAMGSGVLRGDEFNSIAEASPRILRAVSESLGVAQGALKKMAEDGKLTAGVVGGALLQSMSQFELEAKQMPLTVAGSFQILKNNLADTIHKMDKATGVSSSLANAITSVTNTIMSNTNALMNSTSEFSDWIKKHSDGINTLGYIFEMVFGGIVKAAKIAFGIIAGWVTGFIDSIGAVGRVLGIVNAQGKTDAQVKAEQAKQAAIAVDYNNELLKINKELNAPQMTKAAKEKIDMAKQQAEAIKKLVEIKKQEGYTEQQLKNYEAAVKARQESANTEAKVMKKNADAMVKADEAKKKAAEAAKKATSEAAKLAKEWADEEQKINLKVAQSTENKYVQDVLAAQKNYDDKVKHYKASAAQQIKLNEGLQADLAKIQKEATKDYENELEKKAKIEAEWAVKIFEFSDKISDAIIEQNAKMYGNEQISEIDKWYNVQLEALGKLTAEIPMTTQQVDELIAKIEQLRSLRITEQTLSFKIEKTFFKSLEDGLQEAIEDAFNGKLSIEKFFNTIKNNLLKTLTGDVSSSIAGLFRGVSLFGAETGGAPDFLSTVASMVGSISSDTTVQTAGGTIIDKLTGAITQQGSDIETIAKVATSGGGGGGGIGDIFGNLSNIQSIATLPQKFQSLVSFVQNPTGWMSNFGATTGGFTGDMAAGFSNWMAGGGSSSAGLGTGSLGGQVGYYGGGMAAGAGMGYAAGYIGDKIMGSQTQAANYAAIGGAIGSIVPVIGTAAGIAIGALIGGSIGTQKEDNKAIDIFKASSEGVTGQDRITYKTKSWYGVTTDVSTQMFDEATAKSIQKVIESYDYMLNQLGSFDKIVVENQAFESVAKFVDEGITKAFLQATGQANVDAVYTAWTEYAKSIDKTTQEAFATQIQAIITTKRGFDEWYLNFTGDTTGALKFKADYLTKDLDKLKESMGATGVTAADFAAKMDAAVKENFTPETIANWQALGQTIQASEEATRAYQTALAQNIATIDAIIEKSKGQDSTQQKYLKTIEELTGITINSISDIERVGNSLKGMPNITTDAINAFGSLADSIVAMNAKVESSVKSSIASVMPETVDIKADYLKFFDTLPTTLEDWKLQGEALVNSLGGGAKTIEQMVSDAYTQNLGRAPDEGGFQYWTEQLNSGAIAMGDFLGEFKKATEATDNVDLFTLPTISDEQLNIYRTYGETLKATITATQATITALADTTTAMEDFTDSLRSLAKFEQEFSVWRLNTKGDTTGALKLQLDYALEAVSSYEKQLGVTGININNYIDKMKLGSSAVPANAETWENLGRSLMEATDLQKEYADALGVTSEKIRYTIDQWREVLAAIDGAIQALRPTSKTFSEIANTPLNPDNYSQLLADLEATRQAERSKLEENTRIRIAGLEKEKQRIGDITNLIKSLSKRIVDVQPANNADYRNEIAKVKEAIAKGLDVDFGDLTSSTSTYLDKTLKESTSKLDYITETAKVREEVNGLKGIGTGSTLEDIERAIQDEERRLKEALAAVDATALAILDSWKIGVQGIIDSANTNAAGIIAAINASKVAPIQPVGAAGITPRPLTANETSSFSALAVTDTRSTRDIVTEALTAAVGSTPSASVIDAWTAKAEATSLSAIGVPQSIIDGSHANGLDYVPFDGYMAELHRGERVKTKGQARQEDSERDSLKADIAELKAINIKNTAELQRMAKVITRADDGDALRVRITA